MVRFLQSIILFAAAVLTAQATQLSFNDGESFRFRIGWGIFSNAGELTVEAQREDLPGQELLRITSKTRTSGIIRGFYPFDGISEFLFDANNGRMLTASARTSAKRRQVNAFATADYKAGVIRYEDRINPDRSANLAMPDGQPMDMITMMLNARNLDLKPGDEQKVVVMFDRDFYELIVSAERIEKVNTEHGLVDALVVVPRMEVNPRGIFKRGGQIRIWISQDAQRLPLKFDLQMKLGTGTAYLTDYDEGTVAAKRDANPAL